jgi:dipeptidyl aminopeptidase/acylaminoacyl peptidase
MCGTSIRAGLILTALLGASAQAAAPQAPAAAFAALPQVSDVALSPDGKLLAWLDQSQPVGKVVIFDLAAKKYQRSVSLDPSLTLHSIIWTDDDTVLVGLTRLENFRAEEGRRRDLFYRIMALTVDSGKTCMLSNGGDVLAWQMPKPHTVLMSARGWSPNASGVVPELLEVDTHTCKQRELGEGNPNTTDWVVDTSGEPIARGEWEPQAHRYWIEARDGIGWPRILERDEWMRLWGLGPDRKSVIAGGPGKDGWARLWTVALDGSGAKRLQPPAAVKADTDVLNVVRDRFSGVAVAAELGGLEPTTWWLDTAAQSTYESVANAFPGRDVTVESRSEDGTRVVARVEGPANAPVYYLVDFKSHRADIIGEAYPGLDKATLGPVRTMTYPARDGTPIGAYLTLPPGVTPKNLPLVVLPHDWPDWRNDPDFDWFAQFLATRGYAVLQPQYRGTPGFGETFYRAGRQQLGGLIQNDITDGVQAMIRQGIADPHRICIVGRGFGGFDALAGAAFTPGLYACAESINGVSDLPAFLGFRQVDTPTYADYWAQEIGSRFDRNVIDRSPINSVADITVPVLLLHAPDDTFVPYSQSERMAGALAGLGKPVALVKLKGGDHWLSQGATRLETLQETDVFLRQYLK